MKPFTTELTETIEECKFSEKTFAKLDRFKFDFFSQAGTLNNRITVTKLFMHFFYINAL